MSLTIGRVRIGRRSELRFPLQRFEADGRSIVVVDLGDELVALDDTCSHDDASLADEGELDAETREIECCRHGARFSLDDGSVTSLPATTALRTYPVTVEGGELFVEIPR